MITGLPEQQHTSYPIGTLGARMLSPCSSSMKWRSESRAHDAGHPSRSSVVMHRCCRPHACWTCTVSGRPCWAHALRPSWPGHRWCSVRAGRPASVPARTEQGQKAPRLQPGDAWPSPLACVEQPYHASQQARRPHSVGRRAPRTTPPKRVLEARSTGRLALLVRGRVPPECALASLGRWTGRLRRPWGWGWGPEL